MRQEPVTISSQDGAHGGVLRLPSMGGLYPGVVLIHGSLEQDRHGNMLTHRDGRDVPPHPFLDEVGSRLAAAGFAALSWDKRGFASSTAPEGTYWDQAQDARAALDVLGDHPEVDADRRFVFGQSAGVFVASILAGVDDRPRAYVLSGGLGSSFKTMLRTRYGRLREFATSSEDRHRWLEDNFPAEIAMAIRVEEVIAAAEAGEELVRFEHGGRIYERRFSAQTWDEEIHRKMVRNVRAPALVIHATADHNVPPADADVLVAALRDTGNPNVRQAWVAGADHSFQLVPQSDAEWVAEQTSLACFSRPYAEEYFEAIVTFLRDWSERADESSR